MTQQDSTKRRRMLSLPLRISLLLIIVAVVPLLIAVSVSEWQSRPALVNTARTVMETDAHTRTQLLDNYLSSRLAEARTLALFPSVQAFLKDPVNNQNPQQGALILQNTPMSFASTIDNNYRSGHIFDTEGKALLSFPPDQVPPPIPSQLLEKIQKGQEIISDVFLDPKTQEASISFYSPVTSGSAKKIIGITGSTISLGYIWNTVNSENGANGEGSYAFILDQNGVRIADTEPLRRFTVIAPFNADIQKQINDEHRYGKEQSIQVLSDDTIARIQRQENSPTAFENQPAGKKETFQVVRQKFSIVPWTYFVLSPVSTVVTVANQQLLITIVVTLAALLFAASIGLALGRNLTIPILKAVEYLRHNSKSLNLLALQQKNVADQQRWVVDSSQVGLQSMQYYSNAMKVAAQQLKSVGTELVRRFSTIDTKTASFMLENVIKDAQYIEDASLYQNASSEKMTIALKLTTEVSNQLSAGATSAADASDQLEAVVYQLRHIVGNE